MSSGKSGRTVGSPPEYWIAGVGTGRLSRKFFNILRISSWVGSNNVPDSAAFAKHIGHLKLHLFVTSINPNMV
jgi:hypothetical protein